MSKAGTGTDPLLRIGCRGRDPLRILLSEGSSTSAREALTILGLQGHHVEICDPDPHCICRFSRFLRRFHRCPAFGIDPEGYVSFVMELLSREAFDILLPIHEQGFALAKVRNEVARHAAVALPAFQAYDRAHSKAGFSRLLSEIGLPQPRTRFLTTLPEALAVDRFPLVLKSSIGTASRGVWVIRQASDLARAAHELEQHHAFEDVVLAQEWIDAPVEHAQAVFSSGRLLGAHSYRQIARGAGGGDAVKESMYRPTVVEHLSRIGSHLHWHGALSVDYLMPHDDTPYYIDCNPRLVEPVNAALAGNDLLNLLLQVTLNKEPPRLKAGRDGVRSHMALQGLLGCAIRTESRLELGREAWHLATKRGVYSGSQEELTSLHWDWPSVIPALIAALWLVITPKAAANMHRRAWGDHFLNIATARIVRERVAP